MFAAIVLSSLGAGVKATGQARPAGASDPNPALTEFCESTELVEDFGLSALPPTREAPADGDLPFGPKTVSIELLAGPVVSVGGSVGFWLNSDNHYRRTPLRWAIRNRLRTVDPPGNAGPVLARGRQRVRLISSRREVKLFLESPEQPGFYLYEVEIVDFDGRRLARYAKNIRVEREFWDVRLGLNRGRFHPGNHVLSRVENFGTLIPEYGEPFSIERLVGSRWERVDDPTRDGWLLWAGWVWPGRSGQCSTLGLPRDFPTGHFRIGKEVTRSFGHGRTRTYHLSAPFDVVPRSTPLSL